MPAITPFLWFDDQAEEAAQFYTSVFPRSSILDVDPCRSVLLRGSDDDDTPLRGVGERIRDEIEEDLLDPCPVSQDR